MDFSRPKYPLHGLPASEVAAAMLALAEVPDVKAEGVLMIEAHQDGSLMIQTGFLSGFRAGAGRRVLMRRMEIGWTVVEVTRWIA